MNRREFCLTTGLLMAVLPVLRPNNAFGGTIGLQPSTRSVRFRAKKVFLDSWSTGIVHGNSHIVSFVQNQLNAIRIGGCNGLILVPGRCTRLEWMKQITTEANRMELTLLIPTPLTRDFFDKTQTVVPLAHEEGIYQCCDEKAANEGGFLLLNATDNVFGLVLYDASRCHWTGYASSDAGVVQKVEWCEHDSKLTAARWLDLMRQSFS